METPTSTSLLKLIYFAFPNATEIAHFLSDEECDHIMKLAKDEGLEKSRTLKEGIQEDTRALGKNTKMYFDLWDLNEDGHIDVDEVTKQLAQNEKAA